VNYNNDAAVVHLMSVCHFPDWMYRMLWKRIICWNKW